MLISALTLLACAGCEREPLSFNVRLDPLEDVAVGAPVRSDGQLAGWVAALSTESQRTARLVFRSDLHHPPRVGTVITGVSAAGIEVQAAADPEADQLESGTWLPRRRASGSEVLKGAVAELAAAKLPWLARLGLDAASLLWVAMGTLIFLWLLRASIVAGLVSMIAAWLGHAFLLPTCSDLVLKARANQAAVTAVGSTIEGGSMAAAAERTLTAALSQLPGPTVLAAGCVFLGAYATIRLFQAARR
jgi:hypothetical protein